MVVSHEILAGAGPESVARAMASFPDHEVHVVLTARDLGRQIPAEWQERVKHRGGRDFAAFLKALQRSTGRTDKSRGSGGCRTCPGSSGPGVRPASRARPPRHRDARRRSARARCGSASPMCSGSTRVRRTPRAGRPTPRSAAPRSPCCAGSTPLWPSARSHAPSTSTGCARPSSRRCSRRSARTTSRRRFRRSGAAGRADHRLLARGDPRFGRRRRRDSRRPRAGVARRQRALGRPRQADPAPRRRRDRGPRPRARPGRQHAGHRAAGTVARLTRLLRP